MALIGVNGGLIGLSRRPTQLPCSGLWTTREQAVAASANSWPVILPADTVSSLLLLYEGLDGSTSPTDSSVANNTITRTSGGYISSEKAKQGYSSYYVNASSAKLKGSNTITVSGDFMWQCWWYPEFYQAGYKALFGLEGASNSWQLFINDDGSRPLFFLQHRPGFSMILDTSGQGAIPTMQWNHIALTRSSGTLRLFLNGTLRGSTTYTGTMTGVPVANEWFSGTNYLGYIDMTQMVNGAAVYTSTFTPSSTPYTGS